MSGSQSYPPPGGGPGEPPPPGWAPPPAATAGLGPAARLRPGYAPSARRRRSGRRACSARPTSPARCRCDRSGSVTSTTRRSGSSASTRRRPSARPCSSPPSRWRSRCWSPPCSSLGGRPLARRRCRRRRRRPSGRLRRGRAARSRSAAVLQYVGLIFVTGMIAHVTAAAAIGRRLSLGEAWAATRGSRWRLVGLTVLRRADLDRACSPVYVVRVGAWSCWLADSWVDRPGLVRRHACPRFVALACWFWIRVTYLPVPALMIERIGVFAAIGRGYRLTRRQFWRTFGIAPAHGRHHRDRRPGPHASRSRIVGAGREPRDLRRRRRRARRSSSSTRSARCSRPRSSRRSRRP